MREHVTLMQAMGYRYDTQEKRLLRLDRFLQGRPDLSGPPPRCGFENGHTHDRLRSNPWSVKSQAGRFLLRCLALIQRS